MIDRDHVDLSSLEPPASAPRDGRQIIGWIEYPLSHGEEDQYLIRRWAVVQWVPQYQGGAVGWYWSVPGSARYVTLLGWLPLPWDDEGGKQAAEVLEKGAR